MKFGDRPICNETGSNLDAFFPAGGSAWVDRPQRAYGPSRAFLVFVSSLARESASESARGYVINHLLSYFLILTF
jgi:hypothetical protein